MKGKASCSVMLCMHTADLFSQCYVWLLRVTCRMAAVQDIHFNSSTTVSGMVDKKNGIHLVGGGGGVVVLAAVAYLSGSLGEHLHTTVIIVQ